MDQVSAENRSPLEESDQIEELQSHNSLAVILASRENTAYNEEDSGSKPPPSGGNSLRKDRSTRPSMLKSLWSIKSKDIGIRKSVLEALKQDYSRLLIQSPADHYKHTCNVETHREPNRVLWRFLTTLYCDLISELDGTKQRCSVTEDCGIDIVVAVICKSGTHELDTVRKKVMGWVRVGRRYRRFMQALCSGCIILFPEKVSDLVWEQYVPIQGDLFAKVIQCLQDLGIVGKCEEEGWNDMSDNILQTLRENFRRHIPFRFQLEQQSQSGSHTAIRSERSMRSHQRVLKRRESSSRTLDPKALPRLAANGEIRMVSRLAAGRNPTRGYLPQPTIALVLQDLWRTPVEQRLFRLYLDSICARRTVFTYPNSNSYTRAVSAVSSQRCEGVMAMIFCLSCAYMKVAVSSESEVFTALELRYYGKVIRFLSENVGKPGLVESILMVVWLLVHHQVVSEDQSANRRWSMHCKVLGILQSKGVCINYEWALFPTYESVVKFTGLKNEMANDGIDVREFMKCNHPSQGCDRECPQKLSMVSDWGGSRELLVLMSWINVIEVETRGLPDQRINAGRQLEARIRAIKQWTKEPVERNREVALEIARSYELTARVKVMARLLGYTTLYGPLQEVADELALSVLNVPDGSDDYEKHLYTMQFPLVSVFWASIISSRYGKLCLSKLKGICHRSKTTNISVPVVVIEQILEWQEQNPPSGPVEHGWLERMKRDINLQDDVSLG